MAFPRIVAALLLVSVGAGGDGAAWAQSSKTAAAKAKPTKHSPFVPKGYKLTFQDEFNGKELDLTKWNYRQLGERDGTLMVKETVSLDGKGNLLLSAINKDGKLHCSMISTEETFLQKYGYYESRIKFERQQGIHGAFWLQSPTFGAERDDLTASGVEIDIVEFFGVGRSDGGVQAALHWNGYGKDLKSIDKKVFTPANRPRTEIADDFHIFAASWTKAGYRFTIDGIEFFQTSEAISHRDQYVILSLLSSPWEREKVDVSAVRDVMTVDYVRVYARP